MSISDVIRKRRSVRTFDGTPLRDEDIQKLMAFAAQADNPYQLPIRWQSLLQTFQGRLWRPFR